MIKKSMMIVLPALLLTACLILSFSAYRRYTTAYVKTYVAGHQLAQRSRISFSDLQEVTVPKEFLSEDVYTDKNDIIGKYVKLSYSIPKGSLLYKGALESDIKDLAGTLLFAGQVNYDIFVSEVKVNTGSIAEGMYVDLYLTVNSKEKTLSDLLIADCRITGLYDMSGKKIMDFDRDSRVQIMSIAVSRQDIPLLNKAMISGDVSILLSEQPYLNGVTSSINSDSELLEYLE